MNGEETSDEMIREWCNDVHMLKTGYLGQYPCITKHQSSSSTLYIKTGSALGEVMHTCQAYLPPIHILEFSYIS